MLFRTSPATRSADAGRLLAAARGLGVEPAEILWTGLGFEAPERVVKAALGQEQGKEAPAPAPTDEGQASVDAPPAGAGTPAGAVDDGLVELVHGSTIDELRELLEAEAISKDDLRAAETAPGGRSRKGVLALADGEE